MRFFLSPAPDSLANTTLSMLNSVRLDAVMGLDTRYALQEL
jgi:hypothetical protein